ncbi:BTB/POZ domain-containing protein At2g24240-like [Mangifera indica]|uniref:BTB/POZ domain-containing protein At2g24240-like n=1 Tax=Mangifera indica TaxID=29780 RepID=UPI001CFBCBE8|nr:BTB/POZ domain-containing protein At2g24240-like [Mangifera indica]
MAIQKDRVKFNVRSTIFETTIKTLANTGRNSFFGTLFDENWELNSQFNNNSNEALFIDRNPKCFSVLLDLLCTGDLNIPPKINERLFYREASFYGLLDHVRMAKWGPFDVNRLRLAQSVKGQAPGDARLIRARPDGGCCVAHGSIVHVYDWMLKEHPPINLDYRRVNDIGWVDSENLVTACQGLGGKDGGMGLFSASSGELRYEFHVSHDNQVKSFTAGVLSFSSDHKIFSSCKVGNNECGVGVWDQVTGKQIDFFYERDGWSLGDADKLQWLNGRNCLLLAKLYQRKDKCYIYLLDFRDKNMVCRWSDILGVTDAFAMEESNSIYVVNEHQNLGFIDLRFNGGSVRWMSRDPRIGNTGHILEPHDPKLALHKGQMFSLKDDSISIFCGPDWVFTSKLQSNVGRSFCDFSIGGDRLFALHRRENVFAIWECPPPPIM